MGNCLTPAGPSSPPAGSTSANERYELEKQKTAEKKRNSSSKKRSSSSKRASKAEKAEKVTQSKVVIVDADLERPKSSVKVVAATQQPAVVRQSTTTITAKVTTGEQFSSQNSLNHIQRKSTIASPLPNQRSSFVESVKMNEGDDMLTRKFAQRMSVNEGTKQITFKSDEKAGPKYEGASKMRNVINASILNRLLKSAQDSGYGVGQNEMMVSNQADRPPGCFIVPENPAHCQVFFNENNQGVDDGLRRRKSLVDLEAASLQLRQSSVANDAEEARIRQEREASDRAAEARRIEDNERARLTAQRIADEAFRVRTAEARRVADAELETRRIAEREESERIQRELAARHAEQIEIPVNTIDVTPVATNSRAKRQSRSRVFKDQPRASAYNVLYSSVAKGLNTSNQERVVQDGQSRLVQAQGRATTSQIMSTPRTSVIGSNNVVYNTTSQGVQNRVVQHATRNSYDLPLASPGVSTIRIGGETTTLRSSRVPEVNSTVIVQEPVTTTTVVAEPVATAATTKPTPVTMYQPIAAPNNNTTTVVAEPVVQEGNLLVVEQPVANRRSRSDRNNASAQDTEQE